MHLWKLELSTLANPATLPATSAPSTSVPSGDDPHPPRYSANPYPEIADGYYWVENVRSGEYLNFPPRPPHPDALSEVSLIVLSHV
jgi:hypothetical protein